MSVGDAEGLFDGIKVGTEGDHDGDDVGLSEGCGDGLSVGWSVEHDPRESLSLASQSVTPRSSHTRTSMQSELRQQPSPTNLH